jgi:hypothetical protein
MKCLTILMDGSTRESKLTSVLNLLGEFEGEFDRNKLLELIRILSFEEDADDKIQTIKYLCIMMIQELMNQHETCR